jgi:hypothetical protein
MKYTVRIELRVRNTKRTIRQFIRPEYAHNTSSHATKFDTMEDAQAVADRVSDYYRNAGHTVIGEDYIQVLN